MSKQQDFAPLPIYQETSTGNGSWVNVTLTAKDFGLEGIPEFTNLPNIQS